MNRRALLLGGLTASVGAIARADEPIPPVAKVPTAENLQAYWKVQSEVIQYQRSWMDTATSVAITGDSRTAGMALVEIAGRPVQNWGFAGVQIGGLSDQIVKLCAARPPALIGMAGIVTVGTAVAFPDHPEWINLSANIARMLDTFKKVSDRPCVCTVPGYEIKPLGLLTREQVLRSVPLVQRVNNELRAAAKERGMRCFDMAAHMSLPDGTVKPGFTLDGVHWSKEGAFLIKPFLEQTVDALFV